MISIPSGTISECRKLLKEWAASWKAYGGSAEYRQEVKKAAAAFAWTDVLSDECDEATLRLIAYLVVEKSTFSYIDLGAKPVDGMMPASIIEEHIEIGEIMDGVRKTRANKKVDPDLEWDLRSGNLRWANLKGAHLGRDTLKGTRYKKSF